MERLKRNTRVARRIHQISGLTLDCYFSASKMRWLYDHRCRMPQVSAREAATYGHSRHMADLEAKWRLTLDN